MRREKILELFEKNKSYMQDRINNGIEENRKAYTKITIKDANDNPIKNAKIKVVQKTHEFKYGANIFMLDELETPEKNKLYKKYFKECFNMATLPFYWNDLEPEKGKTRYEKDSPKIYRRPAPDLCLEFCEKNGIEPREHALAYEHFFPKWLENADVQTVKNEFVRRCKEISERYADKIPTIEVTNEMLWEDSITPLYFEPDFVEWCFKTARKFFPANILGINEATWIWDTCPKYDDRYYLLIENTLLKGAQIDAIGMQYHMFYKENEYYEKTRRLYNPLQLYKVLDTYSQFNKDIQITEITIPCYTNTDEDEELQATIIEYLYSIWFSHKNVSQIIYWNLVDGYAAFAPQGDMEAGENYYRAGLLRFDFTPKPAYYKIKDLFNKKWHTEIDCISDTQGTFEFKGFYGTYDIIIEKDGKVFKKQINSLLKGQREFNLCI